MLDNHALLGEGMEQADPSEYFTAAKTNQQSSLRKNDGLMEVVVAARISLRSETYISSEALSVLHLKIFQEIMPFAATWMDLEIIMLSKSERERQIPHDITYMWNLKSDTNELTYETESDPQTIENKLLVTQVEREGVKG